MHLPIEKWGQDVRLPAEALDALRESAVCFRAGAYRAALLLSYVSWGLVLRSRLLAAKCPAGFPPARWTSIRAAMANDDKWDAEVFDATQVQNPASIFGVSDDLRIQVRYWKDRRNDCAHSKRNAITAAHVEALWEFLRSNLDKFQVGGSTEDLIERIRIHFDPNVTSPSAPVDDLARAIDATVPLARRAEFLELIGGLFKRTMGKTQFWTPEAPRFFEAVLRVGSAQVVIDTTHFLHANEDALFSLLLAFPEHTPILASAPDITRKLWRTGMSKNTTGSLSLYTSLLRNGLIPAAELTEANTHVIDNALLPPPQNQVDFDTLKKAGFFSVFRQRAFIDLKIDKFDWGNRNATLAAYYVATFAIDDDMVRGLVSVFQSPPYPNAARSELLALFSHTPAKHAELAAAVRRLGVAWPQPLLGPPTEQLP